MLTSAVQHARDGLGKRKDKKSSITPVTTASFNVSTDGDLLSGNKYEVITKTTNVQQQLNNGMPQSNASSTCSSVGSGWF
jgi:hypothetical protein